MGTWLNTVWKFQNFTLTFNKSFVKLTLKVIVYLLVVYYELISRNIFSSESEFLVFPHCAEKSFQNNVFSHKTEVVY